MWRYNPSIGTYYNHITYGKNNYTHTHLCVYVYNVCLCGVNHKNTYVFMCIYTSEDVLGFYRPLA